MFNRLMFLFSALLLAFPVAAKELPDFTGIVEQNAAAVVNVSTTQTVKSNAPQFPNIPEDDPFYEFFRRFAPNFPYLPREFQSRSLGSGFVISPDGYILTNAHVVDSADEIIVKLVDKREFKAKVIGADKRTDVALIKIDAQGLPTVRFGDPNKLKVGEWVVAIGSPFGFEHSVTAGIVSAKGRSLPQENFVPFIQTDVAINPGNSGGPLFNMQGEVVGINSQIYSRTGGFMGLSFAIPIDVAMDVADQLRAHGKVRRGKLGVVIQEVTRDLAESFGLPKPAGALIASVEKGSPAEKAGLEVGDIIVKYDGKAVASSSDLPRMVGSTKPGTKVTVQVWRKGATKDIQVTVGELPEEQVARASGRQGERGSAADRLGLVLSDLPADKKKELGLEGGVLVEDVKPGPAARAGIRPGDVILGINNEDIKSVEQFRKIVTGLEKGRHVALLVRRGESTTFLTARIDG
ncbi:DegQ family serine endoprotease [Pelomicrobium sp.]|jgi:serine protease Do|uniref:DegQ family serine endoprotease n=1 Tax=Pelomicrobium sp. TaxID=2815319 RepID=UPI002FDD4DFB